MTSYARKTIASTFAAAALLSGAAAAPASAQQNQDGLINVAVGDVTITDAVDIGVAPHIAANLYGIKVGPVAVLGVAVDRSGDTEFVCSTEQGDVTLEQN